MSIIFQKDYRSAFSTVGCSDKDFLCSGVCSLKEEGAFCIEVKLLTEDGAEIPYLSCIQFILYVFEKLN
jgi:hypothetical protein